MLDLDLDIEIVDRYFAMDAEGSAHDSWARIKTALAESQPTPTNTGSPKFSAESNEFIGKLLRSQIDLPPDIAEAVNEHFWDLL